MLERFTERARRVVVLATDEARRRGHSAVEPAHLLMGVLRDGEGMGAHLLHQLAEGPLGDIYDQPSSALDVAVNVRPFGAGRLKLAARNLTDPRQQILHGDHEVSAFLKGRSYSLSFSDPS